MSRLRRLDIDDLILLRGLLEGKTITECAKSLFITQPACTMRIRRIEWCWGEQTIRTYHGRNVSLNDHGRMIAQTADEALKILEALYEQIHREKTPRSEAS